jgi:hypothetical protein
MSMWNAPIHSYEEIREVVIAILLGDENTRFPPEQWSNLTSGVAEVISRRQGTTDVGGVQFPTLHPHDSELIRDVFWDLFRQGFITLGLNDSNAEWPFFRLSHFGQTALKNQNPYRFHDTNTYIALAKNAGGDLSQSTIVYLEEAVAAFYADCLLSCCVMIGCAAEAEFIQLTEVAAAGKYGERFQAAQKPQFIRQKIEKFHNALRPLLGQMPKDCIEDLETNFAMIQSVLRIARNDAGHPTGATPKREQVYVFLQLFVPFIGQLEKLRLALA